MEESFENNPIGDVEKLEIVRWELDVYLDGKKDETREFTSVEDMNEYMAAMQAENSRVSFGEPREVTEPVVPE